MMTSGLRGVVVAAGAALLLVAPSCSKPSSAEASNPAAASDAGALPATFHIYASVPLDRRAIDLGIASDGTLRYAVSTFNGKTAKMEVHSEVLVPSQQAWSDFWAAMDSVDAWGWSAEYESGSTDGVYWGVEMVHAGHKVKSEGHNTFPLDAAEVAKLETARAKSQASGNSYDDMPLGARFTGFVSAVQRLTGGRKFWP